MALNKLVVALKYASLSSLDLIHRFQELNICIIHNISDKSVNLIRRMVDVRIDNDTKLAYPKIN